MQHFPIYHGSHKRQADLLRAYQSYMQKKNGIESLNPDGICMALSIGFCHSALMQCQDLGKKSYFDLFLENFHTEESIEKFFKHIEKLTESYSVASAEQKPEILMQLQGYWEQLAIINLALMIYAEPSMEYSIGVLPVVNKATLEYAGLEPIAVMTSHLSLAMFEDFFFERDISNHPSVLSPFAPGGTYLIQVPGHLCAAHVSSDGVLTYYDPNNHTYIKNKKELRAYLAIMEEEIFEDNIPVTVFVVRLKTHDLDKNNIERMRPLLLKQLAEAREYYWAKQKYHPENPRKMIQSGLFQSLCYLGNTKSVELFTQTLNHVAPYDLRSFMLDFFSIDFSKERYELLNIVLQHSYFEQWLAEETLYLKKIFRYWDFNLMTYVLRNFPEGIKLDSENLGALLLKMREGLQLGRQAEVHDLFVVVFERALLSEPSCFDEALFAIFSQTQHQKELAEIAVIACQKYLEQREMPTQIILSSQVGLAAYLINTNYSQKTITELLKSPWYIWHSTDYYTILCASNDNWKRLLEQKSLEMNISHHRVSDLDLAASAGRVHDLKLLLHQKLWRKSELENALQYAASQGFTEICRILISYDGRLTHLKNFQSIIGAASKNGHQETVLFLLAGIPPAFFNQSLEHAFRSSLIAGQKKLAVYLQEKYRLPFNVAYEFFTEQAYKEILKGNIHTIDAFIGVGLEGYYLDLPIEGSDEVSLTEAIFAQQYDIAELLIDAGASVYTPGFNYQPLIAAVMQGHKKLVNLLLARGADINAQTHQGQTALMVAIAKGRQEIVRILMSHNASVNIVNSAGQTALFLAVRSHSREILNCIIQAGAELNIVDVRGNTPLIIAMKHVNKSAFKTLLASGASMPPIKDVTGFLESEQYSSSQIIIWLKEAIKVGLRYGRADLLESLCNEKILIDGHAGVYHASLLKAVESGHHLALELFLELSHSKPDLNGLTEHSPHTLLTLAVERKRFETVKFLLKNGADINSVNRMGQSPLYLAIAFSDWEMINLLIQHKASIDSPDFFGRSPLMVALASREMRVAYLLLESGSRIEDFNQLLAILELANPEKQDIKIRFCQKVTSIALEYGYQHLLQAMIRANILFDFEGNKKALEVAISKNNTAEVQLFILYTKNLKDFEKYQSELRQMAAHYGRDGLCDFFNKLAESVEAFESGPVSDPETRHQLSSHILAQLLEQRPLSLTVSDRSVIKTKDSRLMAPVRALAKYLVRKSS